MDTSRDLFFFKEYYFNDQQTRGFLNHFCLRDYRRRGFLKEYFSPKISNQESNNLQIIKKVYGVV